MSAAVMKLLKFRVTCFRSVRDSGWIETGRVTSLIGTNESGKTNLLLPLWKLKPAKDGAIHLLSDAPRREFAAIRETKRKPVFIRAVFELAQPLVDDIAKAAGIAADRVGTVEVARDLDGNYFVDFPSAGPGASLARTEADKALAAARATLRRLGDEEDFSADAAAALDAAEDALGTGSATLTAADIDRAIEALDRGKGGERGGGNEETDAVDGFDESAAGSAVKKARKAMEGLAKRLGRTAPGELKAVRDAVLKAMPSFVYYSTYGNLDSEIYLPHVVENMKRTDLAGRDADRARTLRVLFSFVRLSPSEVLELGTDWRERHEGRPTEDQIAAINEKKKQRSVLLQSASADLTRSFQEWWKQGEYRIRFEADGNHFRIWVSDSKRPEEVELERRSTGLQWFLSFYLIFLVESREALSGSVLLLDEPGHSLHPVAQRDLAKFFENLASTNQLLYTTHSPFLVDADQLHRVRAVAVDLEGFTVASADLRVNGAPLDNPSVYPVHAALGLRVSDTLFLGCAPVLVEGVSDQHYLSFMKSALVAAGRIRPARELVFVPTRGSKGAKTVAAILSQRDGAPPLVLRDGDAGGQDARRALVDDLYAACPDRVLTLSELLPLRDCEIEDLMPRSFMIEIVDRYVTSTAAPFSPPNDVPIMDAAERHAKALNRVLAPGWKVEIAGLVMKRAPKDLATAEAWKDAIANWIRLFERLGCSVVEPTPAQDRT